MTLIIVDYREKLLLNTLEEYNVTVESINLEIGDIILKNNDTELIFERKTYSDLIASINDGRYKEQKLRLLNTYDSYNCSYIIEGKCDTKNKAYSGMIINTQYRDKIRIFHTANINETAELICNIAKKLETQPDYFKNVATNLNDYICNVKVKTKKIENIDPETCYLLQLCQIPTISHKIALLIKNKYKNMTELIMELKDKSEEEKINELCKIDKIGTKKAKLIISYIL